MVTHIITISPITSMMMMMMMRPGTISVMRLCVPSLIVPRVGALKYRLLMVISPMPIPTTTIAGAPVLSLVVWIMMMVMVVVVVRVLGASW